MTDHEPMLVLPFLREGDERARPDWDDLDALALAAGRCVVSWDASACCAVVSSIDPDSAKLRLAQPSALWAQALWSQLGWVRVPAL